MPLWNKDFPIDINCYNKFLVENFSFFFYLHSLFNLEMKTQMKKVLI